MGFLSGKRALIVGVASPRSIAAGIGHAMYREGAELAYTYQNEKLKSRVDQIATDTGSDLTMPLDVTSDEQIENVFTELEKHWDGLDIIVHAVGFARREELKGRFVDNVTRDGWALAQDISAYSFAALARAGQKLMKGRNGSLLTLTYLGSIRALPFYNTMGPAKASLESCTRYLAQDLGPDGHRVNAISAGPIKTLAAAGISNFRKMLEHAEQQAPLRRSVSPEEVGNTAAFLCSDLASGITGETIYVDAGYRNVAMAFEEG